jgi:rhodanese-related sulfurtransferase
LRLPSLTKNQEVVFYCAWAKEASAAREAVKYIDMGYKNVKCLAGGVEAWEKAGYPTY